MKIVPIEINFLNKTVTDIRITTKFCTEDPSCTLIYCLSTSDNEIITNGSIDLTPEQYADWGYDNSYIEDIVLTELNLTRL